jgi:hypothetical protein
MVAKKEERKQERKRKGKDDRTLTRSNLTYSPGPEQTQEEMAITRDLWIHPTTLCISSPCLA